MKYIGTVSRGIKAPIIKTGDDIAKLVVDCVMNACEDGGITLSDRDIVTLTEAIVARAQGNYATVEQISKDVKNKTGGGTVGLVFPIMSRNRFFLLLKAISKGVDKLVVQLSYPQDEVGNPLIPQDLLDKTDINPYTDVLTEEEFYATFGKIKHPFTGHDYIELYKSTGDNIEIILANDPKVILNYTDVVINADVHTRERTKNILLEAGAKKAFNLAELLNESVDGSGYNPEYGLYGSNLATDNSIKLFPRDCDKVVEDIAKMFYDRTGKNIEVMVYGDGAFKDPVGGIWELADPVVAPAYTKGLEGTPNEIKLKFLADNNASHLSKEEAREEIKKLIKEKPEVNTGSSSLGTTPRRLTDLLGSLSDLTSGSGDKGTPIVLIQNYFSNYADE